ncbi:hypothetical protein PLCT1_00949 [Planctomycetaceae bacterium]|nr:hypothetical protein PLCT1_00949 [Planctomycetaceae bacterium]
MNVLEAIRETASADYVLFIGVASYEGDMVRVSPAGQPDVYGLVPATALVEEPQPLGSDAPAPFDAPGLSLIKVRRGTAIAASYKGTPRTLTIPDGEASRTVAIARSAKVATYCIVAGEFRCDNDQLIGPCIGAWVCPGNK